MYSVGSNALSLYVGASIQLPNNCWFGEPKCENNARLVEYPLVLLTSSGEQTLIYHYKKCGGLDLWVLERDLALYSWTERRVGLLAEMPELLIRLTKDRNFKNGQVF